MENHGKIMELCFWISVGTLLNLLNAFAKINKNLWSVTVFIRWKYGFSKKGFLVLSYIYCNILTNVLAQPAQFTHYASTYWKRLIQRSLLRSCDTSLLVDLYTYYSFISNLLTHLSQMEFSTLIKWTSPFHFKGCWVVFFIFSFDKTLTAWRQCLWYIKLFLIRKDVTKFVVCCNCDWQFKG